MLIKHTDRDEVSRVYHSNINSKSHLLTLVSFHSDFSIDSPLGRLVQGL